VYISCFSTVFILSLHMNHSRSLVSYLTDPTFYNYLSKRRKNVGD
jgi:hypothetical protein